MRSIATSCRAARRSTNVAPLGWEAIVRKDCIKKSNAGTVISQLRVVERFGRRIWGGALDAEFYAVK
jgi:hypothetical protein